MSTLTDVPKNSLTENLPFNRAILSNAVKDFEQNYLSDAILYAGQYRAVLRQAVEKALCIFVDGTPNKMDPRLCDGGQANIPTAIITHSLGGYMLMDAINDIYHPSTRTVPEERNAAVKVGCYLNQVFMLANQLKMLDLSTKTSEEQSSQVMKRFRANWDAIQSKRQCPESELPPRQILAISDPNDILSWEVTKNEISEYEKRHVTVANVYLGMTGELFGLYHIPIWEVAASPISAHANYLVDDDVMDIVACGMTGSTINRCTQ